MDSYRYNGVDSYFHFDQSNGTIYCEAKLSSPYDNIQTSISNGDTINIWDAFNASGSPKTDQFKLNIYLANILQTGAGDVIGSGSLSINGNNYSSNTTIDHGFARNYIIGTNNERFLNYNGSGVNYKHNNWNANSADYLLSRSLNGFRFYLDQKARFLKMTPVMIQSINIEGASTNIQFYDPWYREQDGSQSIDNWKIIEGSIYPTGGYGESVGGIFLNQNESFDPNFPNYSLRAPSPQLLNNISYYFTGWSTNSKATLSQVGSNPTGYDQKAVVFTGDSAVVTANYKAQLASNTSSIKMA